MQVNFTNFIRFFTGAVIDETVNIPRLGLSDNKYYLPIFVAGESAAFYVNSSLPFYDGDDFADLELRILNGSGTVVSNLGNALTRITLATGYRFYTQFAFPGIPVGQYQFQVFNTNTNVPKCTSNWFQVMSETGANKITTTVKWRNSRDAYYFDWSLVPEFYCTMRLHFSLAGYQGEGTVDQLQSVNTGRRRNLNRVIDKSYKLSTYYFDDGANDGCLSLFECDYIEINGRTYLAKTIYLPNVRVASKVNIGEVEVFDQAFSSINKYGQLPAVYTMSGYIAYLNNTEILFRINVYSQNNILFSSYDVAAGTNKVLQVNLIPINGRVDIVPNTVAVYHLITLAAQNGASASSSYDVSVSPVLSLTQNQVYNYDWFVVTS